MVEYEFSKIKSTFYKIMFTHFIIINQCTVPEKEGLSVDRKYEYGRKMWVWIVFEGPVAWTGKKPKPGRTWLEKTEPLLAVVSGYRPVAVAVFWSFNY